MASELASVSDLALATCSNQRAAEPVLITGLGSVGRRHLRNLEGLGVRDVILYRTGRGPGESEDTHYPTEYDLDAALARGARTCIVSNPTALHIETAQRAAEAGCALLIEKPLSHTPAGIAALRRTVEELGLPVLVGYQFRFHPTLQRVHGWIRDGALGSVVSAEARWGEYLPGWHPDEDYRRGYSARRDLGGGPLLTLSHPIDYLRWFLGDVAEVSALCAQRSGLDLDVEDAGLVLVRFTSGALASIALDYAARPRHHGLRLTGSEGTVLWDEASGAARLYRASADTWTVVSPPDGFVRNTLFVDEMNHFLACVEGTDRPRCTLDDGERALAVALAAHRSAREGRHIRV